MAELLLNRRHFLRTSGTLAGGLLLSQLPWEAAAAKSMYKVTILHTNDWHSRIEPFDAKSGNLAGMGGAAIRSAVIQSIRKEEERVLLLDAGDVFQGTPYFNMFGGELEFKLMTHMGYDAMTLGNHDFDNGIDGLLKQLPHAHFPVLNCNYDFSGTELEGKVLPWKVIEKNPIRIGIFGVGIELEGLVPKNLYGNIRYQHPVTKANEIAYHLRMVEKCDYVICLSHLGYSYSSEKISDLKFAAQSNYIDLILGGHTHTFMPKPDVLTNVSGKPVMINQVGWAGLQLGRIDLYFSKSKQTFETYTSSVIDIANESV